MSCLRDIKSSQFSIFSLSDFIFCSSSSISLANVSLPTPHHYPSLEELLHLWLWSLPTTYTCTALQTTSTLAKHYTTFSLYCAHNSRGERLLQTHILIGQELQLHSSCPTRARNLYLLSNQNMSL